jgi:hypothetical protein
MSEHPAVQIDRHRRLTNTLLFLVLGPVLYFLSIGPAAKLDDKGLLPHEAVQTVYRPISILVKKNDTLRACVWWYLNEVWKVKRD